MAWNGARVLAQLLPLIAPPLAADLATRVRGRTGWGPADITVLAAEAARRLGKGPQLRLASGAAPLDVACVSILATLLGPCARTVQVQNMVAAVARPDALLALDDVQTDGAFVRFVLKINLKALAHAAFALKAVPGHILSPEHLRLGLLLLVAGGRLLALVLVLVLVLAFVLALALGRVLHLCRWIGRSTGICSRLTARSACIMAV